MLVDFNVESAGDGADKSVFHQGICPHIRVLAEQITGFISGEALRMVGTVGPGRRIIDIAAGSGALTAQNSSAQYYEQGRASLFLLRRT